MMLTMVINHKKEKKKKVRERVKKENEQETNLNDLVAFQEMKQIISNLAAWEQSVKSKGSN